MRGEYLWKQASSHCPRGFPPHAWGMRSHSQRRGGRHGITPTCVGNTDYVALRFTTYRDYPHMRGEYQNVGYDTNELPGLPPHAWGILLVGQCRVDCVGITPTCVGNTESYSGLIGKFRDYPHMRGEYSDC